MDIISFFAKPIQTVKDIFDLDKELGSPSLASQFLAIKCQLHEVQKQLDESYRIAREKDELISRLQQEQQATVTTCPPKSGPVLICQDETYSPDAPAPEPT